MISIKTDDEFRAQIRAAHVEQRLILGEERPLVAEQHFDRIEVDHQLVGFDLAEIRVERRVYRKAGAESVPEIEPGARIAMAGMKFFPWWAGPLNLLAWAKQRPYSVKAGELRVRV